MSSARTDLCGGRLAMIVPTATHSKTLSKSGGGVWVGSGVCRLCVNFAMWKEKGFTFLGCGNETAMLFERATAVIKGIAAALGPVYIWGTGKNQSNEFKK